MVSMLNAKSGKSLPSYPIVRLTLSLLPVQKKSIISFILSYYCVGIVCSLKRILHYFLFHLYTKPELFQKAHKYMMFCVFVVIY